MDVASSLNGLIAAGTHISAILQPHIPDPTEAPEHAVSLNDEVNSIRSEIAKLQSILAAESLDLSTASFIDRNHLAFTLTGCVYTFSEIERKLQKLQPGLWSWVTWSSVEKDVAALVQRLQCHKTSLLLMLHILTCESLAEARDSRQTLDIQLSRRWATSLHWHTSGICLDEQNDASRLDETLTTGNDGLTPNGSHPEANSFYRLSFESTPFARQPYIQTAVFGSTISVPILGSRKPRCSSGTGAPAETVVSLPVAWKDICGVSLADTPNIISIVLPILGSQLSNPDWYPAIQFPLHQAAEQAQTEMITWLLRNGAAINQSNSNELTPLVVAIQSGHSSTALHLLDKGAFTTKGVLHHAAEAGLHEVMEVLLRNGAAAGEEDILRFTPLQLAARAGHGAAVLVLLEHGASARRAHLISKETPLHLAAASGSCAAVEHLIKYSAFVNVPDQLNSTPLHIAAAAGHADVVRLLLRSGARGDMLDHWMKRPQACAEANGHHGVASLLLGNASGGALSVDPTQI